MQFGQDPIAGKYPYKAFYADIRIFDAETYGNYAMLVRDFYASDIQEKFNALFPGIDHASIKASIHNPNAYMEAHREVVERLIAKYKDTTSPLEFYGSKHMAEGIALLLDCLTHKELKGGILADEQGMAKTIQIIIACLEADMKRVMVIAPKTARASTWPTEIRKVSKNLTWRFGNIKAPGNQAVQFELFSWDDLRRMPFMDEIYDIERSEKKNGTITLKTRQRLDELREMVKEWASKFDCIVADEAHRAKHEGSQRSTALRNISFHVPRLILASGTPLTKRPKDLLHPLKLVHHPLVKRPHIFLARYNPETPGYNKPKPVSKQRLNELHVLLRDCYIRREKSQTNLPPKIRYVEKVELDEDVLDDLEKRWEDYRNEVDPKTGRPRKEAMEKESYPLDLVYKMKIREWVALHKVESLSEWVDDLLEAGEKVVIFTQFTCSFDAYMKKYAKIAVGIDGRHSTDERAKAVKTFQENPDVKIFVGNIQAAGEGITLTAASYIGFNDLAYLPTDMLQAEDRIHRGGQSRPCGIYFFLANHEVDEDGFDDFIKSKAVVQRVTNRRDDKGAISDAEWKGDVAGTAVEELDLNRDQIGGDFDWEDAGEDPPADAPQPKEMTGRDWVERQIQRRRMMHAKQHGDLFGQVPHKQERTSSMEVMKTTLPEGKGGDMILIEELSQLDRYLVNKWDIDFSKSIQAWVRRGARLSPKQRIVAMKIVAKNRRYLVRGH